MNLLKLTMQETDGVFFYTPKTPTFLNILTLRLHYHRDKQKCPYLHRTEILAPWCQLGAMICIYLCLKPLSSLPKLQHSCITPYDHPSDRTTVGMLDLPFLKQACLHVYSVLLLQLSQSPGFSSKRSLQLQIANQLISTCTKLV